MEPVKTQQPGELWNFSSGRDQGFYAIHRRQLLPVVVDEHQTWVVMALGGRSLIPVPTLRALPVTLVRSMALDSCLIWQPVQAW